MKYELMGNYNLTGKTIVITGATSGIGLAAAMNLAKSGAFLIGIGRSEKRNKAAKKAILLENPVAQVHFLLADLAIQSQVRHAAQEIKDLLIKYEFTKVDALVNNAGIYLEKKRLTSDHIEETFAVNHLAPFLLTHELMPLLERSDQARVLTVSSYSHRTTPLMLNRIKNPWPYIGLLAYKRSKLCNVLFSYELNRKFSDKLTAFAVDPGLVDTAIASKGSQGISHWVWRIRRKSGQAPDIPAKTILFLAAEEKINLSYGCYFKDCTAVKPSLQARNDKLAKKLWALSCELTNTAW